MGKKRLPRFKRAPPAKAVRPTERDKEIMRLIHRHRFLRSNHVTALLGGSAQQILRRLQLLYHHGYLDRPRAQLEHFSEGGSQPMVYGLSHKGADVIRKYFAGAASGNGGGDVGEVFLDHELLVSDVMVAVELACRERAGVRLLYEDELDLPATHWKVKLSDGLDHGVVPDRIFALECADEGAAPKRIYYFLEADRGTMPVVRSNLAQTSFQRKLLSYEATWAQKVHQRKLGINRFRVLTVTTNEERMKSIVDACSRLKRGHGLFLFTDRRILENDPLSEFWQCGKPMKIGLLI